jgi:type IV pilus assembly protein PilW
MRNSDHGFSLIEALVATVLSLMVVGAALGGFTTAMGLADTSRIMSETNHNLQAAMSLMVRDFVQTGQGVPRGGIPIPSGAGASPVLRPGPPGSGMTFPSPWTTVPAIVPGGGIGPTVLSIPTDTVSLFYVDPTIALNQFPLTAIAADASSMTVHSATNINGADGLKVGDIILFTNALGNAIQMITQVSGGQVVTFAPTDPMGLNQPSATQGGLMALQSSPGVFPPTTAQRVLMISYYVDAVTDPALPRLVRQVGNGPRLAIALGVENLQLSYDLVDGVTNPINVEMPPPGNSANQIRKANLFLTARSLDIDPRLHNYVRNSMATDVGLRSLSFVDRYK